MEGQSNTINHFIGDTADQSRYPVGLFTTNRWITADNWYAAKYMSRMLDLFELDLAWPSWPVNIWIAAYCACFARRSWS